MLNDTTTTKTRTAREREEIRIMAGAAIRLNKLTRWTTSIDREFLARHAAGALTAEDIGQAAHVLENAGHILSDIARGRAVESARARMMSGGVGR